MVVGGTAGIGEYTARKLVERTTPSKLIVSGRNTEAGELITNDLNKVGNTNSHEFIQVDISSMKKIHSYAEQLKTKIQKLNYLVISAGYFSMNGRDESDEGIDKKMAAHYYGRFKLIQELMPLLEEAANAGEDARVMSVYSAGFEGDFYKDDLDLKKGFSLKRAADVCITYNSLMVEELAERHPKIGFIHIYPGGVNTSLGRDLPFWARWPMQIFGTLFATQADDCGDVMTYALTDDSFKTGWHLLNSKAERIAKPKYNTPENRELIYNHSVELTTIKAQ